MNHIVDTCPLTKFEGRLKLLHEADIICSHMTGISSDHSTCEMKCSCLGVVATEILVFVADVILIDTSCGCCCVIRVVHSVLIKLKCARKPA